MSSGCTCTGEPNVYCPRCQALLRRAGRFMAAGVNVPRMPQERPRQSRDSQEPQASEDRFLSSVVRLATGHGWLCYHTHDSRRSAAGFPDLVCTDGTRLLVAELKNATGKLTKEQAVWLELLRHTEQCDVYLWRPKDWPAITTYFTGRSRLCHGGDGC